MHLTLGWFIWSFSVSKHEASGQYGHRYTSRYEAQSDNRMWMSNVHKKMHTFKLCILKGGICVGTYRI